jgi:hypothetical protein
VDSLAVLHTDHHRPATIDPSKSPTLAGAVSLIVSIRAVGLSVTHLVVADENRAVLAPDFVIGSATILRFLTDGRSPERPRGGRRRG